MALDGHKKGSIITSVAVSDCVPGYLNDECYLKEDDIKAENQERNKEKEIEEKNDLVFENEEMQDNELIENFNKCNIAD